MDDHKEEHIEECLVFALGSEKSNLFLCSHLYYYKKGPTFVHRPPGIRFQPRYSAIRDSSGEVSVSCWEWISRHGVGTIHRIRGKFNQAEILTERISN